MGNIEETLQAWNARNWLFDSIYWKNNSTAASTSVAEVFAVLLCTWPQIFPQHTEGVMLTGNKPWFVWHGREAHTVTCCHTVNHSCTMSMLRFTDPLTGLCCCSCCSNVRAAEQMTENYDTDRLVNTCHVSICVHVYLCEYLIGLSEDSVQRHNALFHRSSINQYIIKHYLFIFLI